MTMKRTISGMIGAGSLAHNRRDFIAENVDSDRVHLNICYQNENLKQVYKELFDESVERYNVGKRKDRQITNYYEKIRQGKQEKLFHEVIFQIGNCEDMAAGTPDGELAVKVLDEYIQDFQKRNPTLRVFSCYLHQDEATPHLHIDFVPYVTGWKGKGMDTRVSLKQALKSLGFQGGNKHDTELNQWINHEKEALAEIAREHGIEWEQKGTHEEHLDVYNFKKGNTYPDISLLPAIARLLKIDMNELFSFREELTEKEIGQFVNELSEVSLDSFIKAFEMGKNKIKEYPHCDSLIYSIATVLNAALTLSDVDDEKKLECNNVIVEWLERTAESPNEKVSISSIFMLAAKYIQMEKYKEANIFLDKIPDTVIDATIMKTNVLAHQEGTDIAAFFLEGKLMQTVTNIQNYLYKLIEMEEETGNHCKAEEIAEITEHMVSLFGLWDYGKVVPYLLIAVYRKDVEKCIQLIKEVLMESKKPWKMVESPLYYRYVDTVQGKSFSGVGNNFVHALATEIENKEEYEFLKGNKELEAIFSQYLK